MTVKKTRTRKAYHRLTFSLPPALARDIPRLAKRLGVSQSAFVAEMLGDAVAAMCDVFDELPTAGATPDDVRRAKGKSLKLIEDVLAEGKRLAMDEALK